MDYHVSDQLADWFGTYVDTHLHLLSFSSPLPLLPPSSFLPLLLQNTLQRKVLSSLILPHHKQLKFTLYT